VKGSAILVRYWDTWPEDSDQDTAYFQTEDIMQLRIFSKTGAELGKYDLEKEAKVAPAPEGVTILKNSRFLWTWGGDWSRAPYMNGRIRRADLPDVYIWDIALFGSRLAIFGNNTDRFIHLLEEKPISSRVR
jgi:hypothetical protein